MTEIATIQGRRIGAVELAQVRALLAEHRDGSRYRLSRQLATLWDWRNPAGQLKDMAARTLLLKLERRGWVQLPPCRRASPNPRRHSPLPRLAPPVSEEPLTGPLATWLPLSLREVSSPGSGAERVLFETLLHPHHYLSHRRPVGENLQYLVRARGGRPVACVLFGAAAWQCQARDQSIGWNAATRQRRLGSVTNNARFLVLPWVRVRHLASKVLAVNLRRLAPDWHAVWKHPVHLAETFVDTARFRGTCYRAANWTYLGQSAGRGKRGHHYLDHGTPKAVFVYELHRRTRELLCTPEAR